MNAENINIIIDKADAMLDEGRIEDARLLYLRACELDEDNADAHFMLGAIAAEQGDQILAEKELRAALMTNPNYADANLHLADLLTKSQRHSEALPYAEKAVQADAEYPEAWLLLALLQAQSGNYTDAKFSSQRAVELWPDNVQTHIFLGNVERALGNTKDATTSYLHALSIQPDNIEIKTELAQSYLQLGLIHEAASFASSILEQKPDNADASFVQGIVTAHNGDFHTARDYFHVAVTNNADYLEAYIKLGDASIQISDIDGAISAYRKALSLDPNNVDAYIGLSEALNRSGKHNEAFAAAESGYKIQPDNLKCKFTLASSLSGLDRDSEAEKYLLDILKQDNNTIAAHTLLAKLYTRSGQIDNAIKHQREAIRIDPNNPDLLCFLASGLLLSGLLDEAHSTCDLALKLAPEHPEAKIRQAAIYERQSMYSQAIANIEPLLQRNNIDYSTALTFARLSQHLDRTQEGIDLLESQLEKSKLPNSAKDKIHKLLTKLYDSCGEYERAFLHNSQAHQLRRTRFDPDAHDSFVDSIIKTLDSSTLEITRKKGNPSERPVFIIGMPRSGTSLVEQILASHPMVYGAGELSCLPEISASLAQTTNSQSHYPLQLINATADQINDCANLYLDHLSKLDNSSAIRVTDKLPHNFLYLGVIDTLFPNARVIHIRRNPLDTCLSCHLQDFSKAHSYSYDLVHLGRYFRAYQRIMNHWKDIIKIRYLEINYEDIITDNSKTIREILQFCNVPWDDRCLKFHETRRSVATPSYDQVRLPLYDSSVQRWRNYEKWLGPLIDTLS